MSSMLFLGGRLQRFWHVWFKSEGGVHTQGRIPSSLQSETPLTRSPLIVSGYTNPVQNNHLRDALKALIQKQAVETVVIQSFLAFYNRLSLVPKPNNKWKPILEMAHPEVDLFVTQFIHSPGLCLRFWTSWFGR